MQNSKTDILALLKELIKIPSVSATEGETLIENFLLNYLKSHSYWQDHPMYCGRENVPHDTYGRSVVYGLVKGPSNRTVILMNHHDVVDIECYGHLKECAYDADKITELLAAETSPAGEDFAGGQWLGGRGSCDMKGGTAAQLAYLTEYAQNPNRGSLLFISVPDEESYSAGMRQALKLLPTLKEKYQLEYVLAINSEPNTRTANKQIVPLGSVGKILATVLVQGRSVHLSAYEKGINPIGVLAKIVAATEGNAAYGETCGAEQSIPPVWLKLRDHKETYDVSLPLRASGFCSLQSFTKGPDEIVAMLKKEAAQACKELAKEHPQAQPAQVLTYEELVSHLSTRKDFGIWQEKTLQELNRSLTKGLLTYPEATLTYMGQLLDFAQWQEPVVFIALAPPYYPPVNSRLMEKEYFSQVLQRVQEVQPVIYEEYFLGVSDCSYLGHTIKGKANAFSQYAPLWGEAYSFAEATLSRIQIPFLLLGPWGKDLHQKTERVNITSLTQELPLALKVASEAAWER